MRVRDAYILFVVTSTCEASSVGAVNAMARVAGRPGRDDLADETCAALACHGVWPSPVVLGLSEGSVVAQQSAALATFARLCLHGGDGHSMDDYSAGIWPLQQLSRFPFAGMKVDQSIVIGADRHEHAHVIYQLAFKAALRVLITSVAEGAESPDGWQLLQQMDSELAQGWFIANGTFADEMADRIWRHASRLPWLWVQPASEDPSPESETSAAVLRRCSALPLPH